MTRTYGPPVERRWYAAIRTDRVRGFDASFFSTVRRTLRTGPGTLSVARIHPHGYWPSRHRCSLSSAVELKSRRPSRIPCGTYVRRETLSASESDCPAIPGGRRASAHAAMTSHLRIPSLTPSQFAPLRSLIWLVGRSSDMPRLAPSALAASRSANPCAVALRGSASAPPEARSSLRSARTVDANCRIEWILVVELECAWCAHPRRAATPQKSRTRFMRGLHRSLEPPARDEAIAR